MNNLFLSFRMMVFLFSLISVTGCAETKWTYHSGFLGDYSGMVKQYDMDAVRVAPDADLSGYDTIVISAIDLSRLQSDLNLMQSRDVGDLLHRNFRAEMARLFGTVASDVSKVEKSDRVIRLDLALTELYGENVAATTAIGFGVGEAKGTIEGRLVDLETGRELVAFGDRKKGDPYTIREVNDPKVRGPFEKMRTLYLFTEIWAENVGNIVKQLKIGKF